MDNNQSVQSAAQNPNLINKAAKSAFSDFVKQIPKPQFKGFISEDGHQRIFSFESYLREMGRSEDLIYKYCNHIKSTGAEEAAPEKKPELYKLTDYLFLSKLFLLSFIPGIVLYLLVAAFLWTFEISFLQWKPFILFALSWPVILAPLLALQYMRLKRNERLGIIETEYIIKCFDSDELTFLKSKTSCL